MPKRRGQNKEVILATRVTPRIKEIVMSMADREGLSISEWLRSLIINELKNNKALPKILQMPEIELGNGYNE
jgi:hypothetical protein